MAGEVNKKKIEFICLIRKKKDGGENEKFCVPQDLFH